MDSAVDFGGAARRALFGKEESGIPGEGSSASKQSDRHTRVKITINIDSDIVKHFKDLSKERGLGYQLLINEALREQIEGSSVERMAKEVGQILLSDPSFVEKLSEKI